MTNQLFPLFDRITSPYGEKAIDHNCQRIGWRSRDLAFEPFAARLAPDFQKEIFRDRVGRPQAKCGT